MRAQFRNMNLTDKFGLWTKIVTFLSILAVIGGAVMLKRRKTRAIGIMVMILMTLTTLLTFKIRKALKEKNKRKFKCSLKGFAILAGIHFYNLILYLVISHRRCFFVCCMIVAFALLSGSVARKGRRLFKNQLKAEWTNASAQQNA